MLPSSCTTCTCGPPPPCCLQCSTWPVHAAAQAHVLQARQRVQRPQVLRLHILQGRAAQQRQRLRLQQLRGEHAAVRIKVGLQSSEAPCNRVRGTRMLRSAHGGERHVWRQGLSAHERAHLRAGPAGGLPRPGSRAVSRRWGGLRAGLPGGWPRAGQSRETAPHPPGRTAAGRPGAAWGACRQVAGGRRGVCSGGAGGRSGGGAGGVCAGVIAGGAPREPCTMQVLPAARRGCRTPGWPGREAGPYATVSRLTLRRLFDAG